MPLRNPITAEILYGFSLSCPGRTIYLLLWATDDCTAEHNMGKRVVEVNYQVLRTERTPEVKLSSFWAAEPLSLCLQDVCRKGKTTRPSGLIPQGIHSGNSKHFTWQTRYTLYAKSCSPAFPQLKGLTQKDISLKKKCRKTCHIEGKRWLCNPCPQRGDTKCANPAKSQIKGSCFNPKAQEKNNSAGHFPTCTYRRRKFNTS